jgi:hypothetical protein
MITMMFMPLSGHIDVRDLVKALMKRPFQR